MKFLSILPKTECFTSKQKSAIKKFIKYLQGELNDYNYVNEITIKFGICTPQNLTFEYSFDGSEYHHLFCGKYYNMIGLATLYIRDDEPRLVMRSVELSSIIDEDHICTMNYGEFCNFLLNSIRYERQYGLFNIFAKKPALSKNHLCLLFYNGFGVTGPLNSLQYNCTLILKSLNNLDNENFICEYDISMVNTY